jgi:hypothetical protein
VIEEIALGWWLTLRAVAVATVGLGLLACFSNFLFSQWDAFLQRRHAKQLFQVRYRNGRRRLPIAAGPAIPRDRQHPLHTLGGRFQ